MENQQTNQNNQSSQGNKQGSDLPGTSKDPSAPKVTGDKSQARDNRQDDGSDRAGSGSGYRPESDSQKRS